MLLDGWPASRAALRATTLSGSDHDKAATLIRELVAYKNTHDVTDASFERTAPQLLLSSCSDL